MFKISKITCENIEENCITDNPNPRFSFAVESDNKNTFVTNAIYKINDWVYETEEQISVEYSGKTLESRTEYTLVLQVTDNYQRTAESTITFSTGKISDKWNGMWISNPKYIFKEKKTSPKPITFKKEFSITKKIKSAKIYSTAIGIYELNLNGKKVGTDYFMPGFTSYKHNLQYQVYDIKEQLLLGTNTLISVVGGGWAVGAFSFHRINRIAADRQAFLSEIFIEYYDGTTQLIGTDESWGVSMEGKYIAADFYDGEVYDEGINYNEIIWDSAKVEKLKISPQIKANYGSPVKNHSKIYPISVFRTNNGTLIYDFGQNFAGVIDIEVSAVNRQTLVFKHSEVLKDGVLYTKPLRTAQASVVYICREGIQNYSPKLTYMGFRYVSVNGIDEEHIKMSARVLYSDISNNGSFECSDPGINKLQSNILWSAKSNFMDIPTDCPQRDERMGWTGDIALFSPTAYFNFNMGRFMEKWLLDVKSEQGKNGVIPLTVPEVTKYPELKQHFRTPVDHWGDAAILVPWADYLARGDVGILKKMYPVMKGYIKSVLFWSELFSFGLKKRVWSLPFHFGDWCAPDLEYKDWIKRGKWTATACLANSTNILSEIAGILNENSDVNYYKKISQEASMAYSTFFTNGKGKLLKEFQTAYVLPIYYGIFKGEELQFATNRLAKLVKENNYKIATGFPGTPYILFALADNGYKDVAFKMLLTEETPSWLSEVKKGATTIWERWDGLDDNGNCKDNNMVSFNHYASGAVGDFLYRRVLGIEPIKGGYRKFRIKPLLGGDIHYAKGEVTTPFGRIVSSWSLKNNSFNLNISIPVGTECIITMPDGSENVKGSGDYSFLCTYKNL